MTDYRNNPAKLYLLLIEWNRGLKYFDETVPTITASRGINHQEAFKRIEAQHDDGWMGKLLGWVRLRSLADLENEPHVAYYFCAPSEDPTEPMDALTIDQLTERCVLKATAKEVFEKLEGAK